MDEASRNVVAFLGAVTQAQHTFLQLINDLAAAGLIADHHEPYLFISLHAWRYLEVGVEVDTTGHRRYNLRLVVSWVEDSWQISIGATSQVVRDGEWDPESFIPDPLGLPVRSVSTLDEFAAELREATMSGGRAFRSFLASGRASRKDAEQNAAADGGVAG